MVPSRIIVVDDFKDWRWKVRSILEQQQELLVVGEASDGAEAVQKAGELKPDVIVLDIGLPKLDGITADLRISEISPGSKILFLVATQRCGDDTRGSRYRGPGVRSQDVRRNRTVEGYCRPSGVTGQLAKTYGVHILCGYSMGGVRTRWTATSSNNQWEARCRLFPVTGTECSKPSLNSRVFSSKHLLSARSA